MKNEIPEQMAFYFGKSTKLNVKPKSKNQGKYEGFVAATIAQGINVEDVFEDIPAKKRNLTEYLGYTALKGVDGKWIPLDNAKHSRIGKAYLEHYNRGRKALRMIN